MKTNLSPYYLQNDCTVAIELIIRQNIFQQINASSPRSFRRMDRFN